MKIVLVVQFDQNIIPRHHSFLKYTDIVALI